MSDWGEKKGFARAQSGTCSRNENATNRMKVYYIFIVIHCCYFMSCCINNLYKKRVRLRPVLNIQFYNNPTTLRLAYWTLSSCQIRLLNFQFFPPPPPSFTELITSPPFTHFSSSSTILKLSKFQDIKFIECHVRCLSFPVFLWILARATRI